MSTINIFVEQNFFYEQNIKFGIILKCILSYPHFNNISLLNQITVYYTSWTGFFLLLLLLLLFLFCFCFVFFCFVLFCFVLFCFVLFCFVLFLFCFCFCFCFLFSNL